MQGQKLQKTWTSSTSVDRHCHAEMRKWCVCVCVLVGSGWGGVGRGLLWVMAPVWQGSDRYVIMLTTILPPIVLPETNLLKIHPVPSSPSSANSLQKDWEWWKEKRHWESGDEYQKQRFLRSCFAEQLFLLWQEMVLRSHRRAISFSSALFFLARTCWLFATVDLQLNGICLEWSDLLAAALITH